MAWTLDVFVQIAGAVLVSALGLAVLLVRPRTRPGLWFALFAGAFGAQFIITNIGIGAGVTRSELWFSAGRLILRLATITGALGFALTFPKPLERRDRPTVLFAAVFGGIALSVNLLAAVRLGLGDQHVVERFAVTAWVVLVASLYFMLFLFAGRYDVEHEDEVSRSQYIYMTVALLVYVGLIAGAGASYEMGDVIRSQDPMVIVWGAFHLFLLTTLFALWLRNSRGGRRKTTRNLALLALFMPFFGLVHSLYIPDYGVYGLARILMVSILAYAIIRHRLLGIDIKVRWGISKTTLAGIFVAVFFVASEVAQQFFGERLGGPYVGIVAAGLLVFAIAPLSRFADRVAEKAVPVTDKSAVILPHEGTQRQQAYRLAVLAALRDDGRITAREETHLADLAQTLGVGAGDALRIRREIEHAQSDPGNEVRNT